MLLVEELRRITSEPKKGAFRNLVLLAQKHGQTKVLNIQAFAQAVLGAVLEHVIPITIQNSEIPNR